MARGAAAPPGRHPGRHDNERAAVTRRVAILQSRLFHYRVPLFERLRALLAQQAIELRLVHGQASASEESRRDEGHLEWADRVRNRHLSLGGVELIVQPLPREIEQCDLIVLMQENR